MAEREGPEQPRRYCRNCGAEAAPVNAFCVSCGERLAPGSEGPWRTDRSSASGRFSSIVAALREALRGVAERFGRSPTPSVGATRGVLPNLLRRVEELPLALKVAGAVVGAMLLLTLLSPLTAVGAAVLFVTSVVALGVRVAQQKSVVRWGVVAAVSLVLAFTAAGVSGAVYGSLWPGGESAPREVAGSYDGSAPDPAAAPSEEGPEGQYEVLEVSQCDAVAPELRGLAERWSSLDRGYGPLFLPSYLPFSVERVADWKETFWLYEIWGENTTLALDYIEDSIYRSDMPEDLADVQTMTMDSGLAYYYFVEAEGTATGTYVVYFGEVSEEGPVRLSYRLRADYSTMTPEEFGEMFRSMVKVETSSGEAC